MNTSRKRSPEGHRDGLDSIIVATVIGTVAFAAASFGAVEPWSEMVVILSGALLTGLTIAQIARGRSIGHVRLPLALLGVFGALVAFQLLSLPSSVVGWLGGERLSRTAELLAEKPDSLSISYYPYVTAQGLRRLLVGVAVFAAIAVTTNKRRSIKLLLMGLFSVGVAESLLSIAQIASGAEGMYWSDIGAGEILSGSFLNHSNFAQFLNLTLGAGLGLLLLRLSEDRHELRRHAGQRSQFTTRRLVRFNEFVQRHGWLLAGLTLQAIAIAASLSRGGILAMLVASAVVLALQGGRYSLGGWMWALVVIPPLVFAGLVMVGFDAFYDRLATLEKTDSYADRWELTTGTLRLAADHLALGTGLDTYGWVFPAYDTTGVAALAEQADNDYAQLVAEMGLAGVMLVGAFLVTLAWRIYKRLADGDDSLRYVLYGVLYGLIAVAMQSFTDFGQRLPAVFCVSAALCGLGFAIVAAANKGSSNKIPLVPTRSSRHWVTAAAFGALAVVVWGGAGWTALREYRAERWWSVAYDLQKQLDQPDQPNDPQLYVDLIVAMEQAASICPENIRYAYWLNAFRWQMVTNLGGPTAGTIGETLEGKEIAERIADELASARRLCPTYGLPFTLEGQIRLAIGDPSGTRLVRLGAELAPNSPEALMALARIEALDGNADPDAVRSTLLRAVALDSSRFPAAASMLVGVLQEPNWARELAGDDRGRLLSLSEVLSQFPAHVQLAREVNAQAAAVRKSRVLSGEASAGEVAALAAQRAGEGDYTAAVGLYRKALATNYSNIPWRLALTDALVRLKLYRQAEREVRVCLRLQPGSNEAKRLAEKISLLMPASESSEAAPQ